MDPMETIRETFYQECDEQLVALEEGLMQMEAGDAEQETVNAVFRAVHSVKGGAGAFKLTELVSFAHVFETVLDRIRSHQMAAEPDVLKVLLRASDVLADLVSSSRSGRGSEKGSHASVLEELNALCSADTSAAIDAGDEFSDIDFVPTLIEIGEHANSGIEEQVYRIQFRPYAELYRKANEPLLLLRELAKLGRVSCLLLSDELPSLDSYNVSESYLSFTISLTSSSTIEAIASVFDFVEGDCDLSILPDTPQQAVPATNAIQAQPREHIPEATPTSNAAPASPMAVPEKRSPSVDPPPSVAAPQSLVATKQDRASTSATQTIRVELDRVDRMINLVGELVINQAMLAMRIGATSAAREASITASLEELEHLTRELQDSVMAIRAQPVKSLFQRMARIVREVADSTGKVVRLRTEGEVSEMVKER